MCEDNKWDEIFFFYIYIYIHAEPGTTYRSIGIRFGIRMDIYMDIWIDMLVDSCAPSILFFQTVLTLLGPQSRFGDKLYSQFEYYGNAVL